MGARRGRDVLPMGARQADMGHGRPRGNRPADMGKAYAEPGKDYNEMTNIPELKPLSMTARQMRDAGACYDLQTIKGLWDGRESLTALDILDLGIPDADKLWGVLRENLIPASGLRELACRFAETALVGEVAAGGAPDARSYAV